MEIEVHNLGCLLVIDDTFVAKDGLADLAALDRARSIQQAKMALLRQLCNVQVLLDYPAEATGRGGRHRSEVLREQARNLFQVELATERRNHRLKNYPAVLGDNATSKLNSTLLLRCANVLEAPATALLDRAPEFRRHRLKDPAGNAVPSGAQRGANVSRPGQVAEGDFPAAVAES
ncbi:hypothetical protein pipiens_013773 [Culex pipiens pipiens]|uniref:Uncharacterized protein n=1 Tax=Culex pipiens pipiens TaxID=38569 RepID=A0ABD1CZM4_CULPP